MLALKQAVSSLIKSKPFCLNGKEIGVLKNKTQEIRVDGETVLEILQYGTRKPSVLLIAGIHGDEKTGPELLYRLSTQVISVGIHNKVSLLPVANPKSYNVSKRNHPDDGYDLNRCFLGEVAPINSPSGRLVTVIQQLIHQHEVIIDIHGFPHQLTPITGVFLREGKMTLRQRFDELLRIFKPEVIWELDTKSDEPIKTGSACSYALEQEKPAFGCELADPEYYSETKWRQIIWGLFRVLRKLNSNDTSFSRINFAIPRYEQRKVSRAPFSGIFTPRKQLLEPVIKGEIIGELVQGNEKSELFTEHTGAILTIAPPGQLNKEQKTFATAVPIFT